MIEKYVPPVGFERYAEDLIARFPYQFEECRMDVSVAAGWAHVFAQLCADVDALLGEDKRGFRWDQAKEKWGGARFYFVLGDLAPDKRLDVQSPDRAVSLIVKPEDEAQRPADVQQLTHKLRNLILAAEEQSQRTCAACGKSGELDRSGGWVLTLCHEHAVQSKTKAGLGEIWIIVQHGHWGAAESSAVSSRQPTPNLRQQAKDKAKKSEARAYVDYMLDHFGYQFAGSKIRVASGWKRVFFDLCDRIDKELGDDKRGFHWSQVGEQFGAASFHFDLGEGVPAEVASELIRRLRAIVAQAEEKTKQMCIVCADAGELDRSEPHALVLCPKHAGSARSALEWIDIQKANS